MRRTVTLDNTSERLLRTAMTERGVSFNEALNIAIRHGLADLEEVEPPFVIDAAPLGLRRHIDPTRLNQLADDLEAEDFGDASRTR